MESYTNKRGMTCYKNVLPQTSFDDLEFSVVPDQIEEDTQWAMHTNLGTLTVLNRMTGFGYRDTETGYRDPDGKFWLASGNMDIRHSDARTMQEAIDWVKSNANTCVGA